MQTDIVGKEYRYHFACKINCLQYHGKVIT